MWEVIQFLYPSFIACLLILWILGYLGIHVLEREIVFIDIALAQIAATGSTLTFVLFRQHLQEGYDFIARLFAIGFTLLAAVFFAYVAKRVARISQETVIGVTYAIAAAATLFLLAIAAGGDVHMEEMLTGSILWVQWHDIVQIAIVYSAAGFFYYIFRDRFLKISTDYKGAAKSGINIMWWDFLFYALMGIVITYTIEIAGVLLTFSFLIIPATFSAIFNQSFRKRLFIAWFTGGIVSIGGLVFSYRFDFSSGPSIVSLLGLVLLFAALLSMLKRPKDYVLNFL